MSQWAGATSGAEDEVCAIDRVALSPGTNLGKCDLPQYLRTVTEKTVGHGRGEHETTQFSDDMQR
jgi:hypothetical protein